MAVYKVAQDVEADDKLLGPFTARQFIYLIIVAMAGAVAYFMGKLFMPLAIIPLPVILFFGVLALPLRKDQPMEVYFAALISFYLKPRRRLWVPDGLTSLIEITAPQAVEAQLTKDFTGNEAETRLGYLATIVDTQGWAVRNVTASGQSTSMIGDVYNDAVATQDLLDTTGSVAQGFDTMLTEATERRRQEIINNMHNPVVAAPTAPAVAPVAPQAMQMPAAPVTPYENPYTAFTEPQAQPAMPQQPSDVHFNPYPTIHQSVVQPISADDQITPNAPDTIQPQIPAAAQPSKSTSETAVSPDIIKLVNNSDLSIETMAREAHRIKDKDAGEEVVISLR